MSKTILYIFVYLIEALILWWYSSHRFYSKYSKKNEFILIFIGYICLFILSFTNSFGINSIAFTLINFIIFKTLYDTTWLTALFHSFITTCMMSFSELIIIGLFNQFNADVLYIQSDIRSLIILTALSKTLYFISINIIARVLPGSKDEHEPTNISAILINIIPFISIYITVVLTSVLLNSSISTHFRNMLSACAVLLILINILVFYIYNYIQQKNKEYTLLHMQFQKEYDMAEYYKVLFNQNESQQILIHNIRKHLMTISQLNEQNDHDKISHYLSALLNSSDLQNSVHVSDNELLNSILCHYIKICHQMHITFKVDVRKKLLQNLDYTELTALFCNLLDNSVEACSDIPDSYIELSITDKENTDITVINIINNCRNCPKFNQNGLPVSSKKNKIKHGFGLKSVERIVNKYNGIIKMYFDDEKMAFHTILILRCNKVSR